MNHIYLFMSIYTWKNTHFLPCSFQNINKIILLIIALYVNFIIIFSYLIPYPFKIRDILIFICHAIDPSLDPWIFRETVDVESWVTPAPRCPADKIVCMILSHKLIMKSRLPTLRLLQGSNISSMAWNRLISGGLKAVINNS